MSHPQFFCHNLYLWCMQLHDFGLATWTPLPSVPFLCKTVKGTFGYDLNLETLTFIVEDYIIFWCFFLNGHLCPYFLNLMDRYLAPEYFLHGKVSDKTDVYAFGVVLLELISGQKPIEAKRGPGEENLVSWVGYWSSLYLICLGFVYFLDS